jgi:hypothetical protein
MTMSGGLRAAALSGRGFSAPAIALFAAMDVKPTGTRKQAIDKFIAALVDAGIWDLLDVLHVFAAHTEQAALLNWINPGTNDAVAVDAPTFAADRGFTGNGTSSYVTSVNPLDAAHFVQNDASIGVRILTNRTTNSNKAACGRQQAADPFGGIFVFSLWGDGNAYLRLNATDHVAAASSTAQGLWIGVSPDGTTQTLYRNGTEFVTGAKTSQAIPGTTEPMGVLAVARIASATTEFTDDQAASFFMGAALSAPLVAALTAAELAYMQTVGAVA